MGLITSRQQHKHTQACFQSPLASTWLRRLRPGATGGSLPDWSTAHFSPSAPFLCAKNPHRDLQNASECSVHRVWGRSTRLQLIPLFPSLLSVLQNTPSVSWIVSHLHFFMKSAGGALRRATRRRANGGTRPGCLTDRDVTCQSTEPSFLEQTGNRGQTAPLAPQHETYRCSIPAESRPSGPR